MIWGVLARIKVSDHQNQAWSSKREKHITTQQQTQCIKTTTHRFQDLTTTSSSCRHIVKHQAYTGGKGDLGGKGEWYRSQQVQYSKDQQWEPMEEEGESRIQLQIQIAITIASSLFSRSFSLLTPPVCGWWWWSNEWWAEGEDAVLSCSPPPALSCPDGNLASGPSFFLSSGTRWSFCPLVGYHVKNSNLNSYWDLCWGWTEASIACWWCVKGPFRPKPASISQTSETVHKWAYCKNLYAFKV